MLAEGMLWNDRDKDRTLAGKVYRAADYYQRKYHERATVCYVKAETLLAHGINEHEGLYILLGDSEVNSRLIMPHEEIGFVDDVVLIELRATVGVLLHHFWLGVE